MCAIPLCLEYYGGVFAKVKDVVFRINVQTFEVTPKEAEHFGEDFPVA